MELDSIILSNWSEKKVSDELMTDIHENFKNPTITKLTVEFEHIHNYNEKTYV